VLTGVADEEQPEAKSAAGVQIETGWPPEGHDVWLQLQLSPSKRQHCEPEHDDTSTLSSPSPVWNPQKHVPSVVWRSHSGRVQLHPPELGQPPYEQHRPPPTTVPSHRVVVDEPGSGGS